MFGISTRRAPQMHIAERHLIPKLLKEHGLPEGQVQLPQAVLQHVIQHYTREVGVAQPAKTSCAMPLFFTNVTHTLRTQAGVRSLSRCLSALFRHAAVGIVAGLDLTPPEPPVPASQPPPETPPSVEASACCEDQACAAHQHRAHALVLDAEIPCNCPPRATCADTHATEGEPSHWDRLLHLLGMTRCDCTPIRALAHIVLCSHAGKAGLSRKSTDAWAWAAADGAVVASFDGRADVPHLALRHPLGPARAAESTTTSPPPALPVPSLPAPVQHVDFGEPLVVDVAMVEAVLGPPQFVLSDAADRVSAPGSAAGLVWTAAGGLVQYVECCAVGEGRQGSMGRLTLTGMVADLCVYMCATMPVCSIDKSNTGSMGEVLQESSRIALSWVRSHATELGIKDGGTCARQWDVHVHLPTGAVPKDGPSAGITLAVALVSLFTERCCRYVIKGVFVCRNLAAGLTRR